MLTGDNAINWLTRFCDALIEQKETLSEYDRIIGDGDHGNNMARGAEVLKAAFTEAPPTTLADVFKTAAMKWISTVGGAAGPLYGTAFMEMAKVAATTDDALAIMKAGIQGIEKRGKAVAGEKTMLDLWLAAKEALLKNDLSNDMLAQAMDAITAMKATKGRASFVGDRSVGEVDPGAASSKLLFEAFLKEVAQ